MCFAAAPLVVMLASTAISAGVSAYSASESAKAGNKQADYNTKVAENNALMARQEGAYAQANAMRNSMEKRKETDRLIGAQRAKQGASGVVVDSGTAGEVTMDAAAEGEREAMALLQQGDVEAWRAENQARGHESQGALAQTSKVNVGSVVAGSLLSSAAKAGQSYYAMKG